MPQSVIVSDCCQELLYFISRNLIVEFSEKFNISCLWEMGLDGDPGLEETEASMIQWIWTEISSSYLNIGLTAAILYLIYKILFQKDEEPVFNAEPPTPPMKKQV